MEITQSFKGKGNFYLYYMNWSWNVMIKRIKKKLCGNVGESIAETLVALLISALALVMLAGAISSAAKVIKDSKTAMDTYNEKTVPEIKKAWNDLAEEALT